VAESGLLAAILTLAFGGALLVPFFGRWARVVALLAMLAILAVACRILLDFAPGTRPAFDAGGFDSLGIRLRFAVDGFNLYLLLLTALLAPVVLACTWTTAEGRSRLFASLLLALEAALLATFLAQDLVVLFVAWEAVLIPMTLMILVFGGEGRRGAAVTFFLYTMAGSVLFLAAVIVLGAESRAQTGRWSFDLAVLQGLQLGPGRQSFVFWAIALACAIKSPLVPFHAWLPRAYGAASPAGAALMAGVLSKMGAYGFLRLAIPLAPDAATAAAPVTVALAVTSILYGAVLALTQRDLKRLVAYASLSHMGYIVLGAFVFTAVGVQGALLQMLSHGVIVAGLFLALGLAEQRCGTAWLRLDGLATRAPRLAVVTMLFVLASLALPLTSGFTAEFLVLLGAFTRGLASWRAAAGGGLLLAAVLASLGVVLGAAYMLRLARALVFGDARRQPRLPDLSARELAALAPLLLVILAVGVQPAPWMAKVEPAVAALVRVAPQAATGDADRAAPPAVNVAGAHRAR